MKLVIGYSWLIGILFSHLFCVSVSEFSDNGVCPFIADEYSEIRNENLWRAARNANPFLTQ